MLQEYFSIIACALFFAFIPAFYNWEPGRTWGKALSTYVIYTGLFGFILTYAFLIRYGFIMDGHIYQLIILGGSE